MTVDDGGAGWCRRVTMSAVEFERLLHKLAAWWSVGHSCLMPADVVAVCVAGAR